MCLLETERLQVCRLNLEDAAFILRLVNEPGWLRYIGDRGIHTIAQAQTYLQEGPMASYAANGFGLYLVRRKADQVRLGMCGLVKRPSLPHVDIGFAFLAAHTGQGYAFEAATAVLHHARTTLNLNPIVAITAQDNHRSMRLLEKLGLTRKETVSLVEGEPEVNLFYPKDYLETGS